MEWDLEDTNIVIKKSFPYVYYSPFTRVSARLVEYNL